MALVAARSTIAAASRKALAAKEEQRAIHAVIDREMHAVVTFDRVGRVVFANGTAERLFGSSRHELMGRSYCSLLDQADLARNEIDLMTMTYPDSEQRFEVRGFTGDGKVLPLEVAFTEFDAGGDQQLVAFIHDISARKRQEAAMQQALLDAERANALKGSFMANMSHEVRTPMAAIIGLSELCSRTELDEIQRDYVSKIHGTAVSLLRVLNDILDFSKMEAGELKLESITFQIDDVLDEIGHILSQQLADKRLELVFDRGVSVPNKVIGDPTRLHQILLNLCSNAVKFTDAGMVRVLIECVRVDSHGSRLHFEVSDTGIGMTDNQLGHLFQPFMQADASTSRRYGGTGLGLSICDHLVRTMGSAISVDSDPGKGTTFSFDLDFEVASLSDIRSLSLEESGDALRGMTAIVVDDNAEALGVVTRYLTAFGMEVHPFDDRQNAIDFVTQLGSAGVDLIVFDDRMPDDMTTPACIEKIGREYLAQSRIVVLVDELAQLEADRDLAAAFVVKPVTAKSLLRAVMASFGYGLHPRQSGSYEPRVARELLDAQILLVEDNPINQQVASELLTQAGGHVTVADNGREALELLEQAHFDCVLMDLQMPELDGFETATRIRAIPHLATLPILAMSANAMIETAEQIRDAGMDGCVEKPIEPRKLITSVKHALRDKRASPSQAASVREPVVNEERGLANVGGNRQLYHSLLIGFCRSHGDDARIISRLAQDEVAVMRRMAHTLKGLAGTIGATHCQQAARTLEDAIASKPGALSREIATLQQCLDDVRAWVASREIREESPPVEALSRASLHELRELVEQFSPDAEAKLNTLSRALGEIDAVAAKKLDVQIRGYDFTEARTTLSTLEAGFEAQELLHA